jgi:hypothetical protein
MSYRGTDLSPPNLVFESLSDLRLLVSYLTERPPSDGEWDAWIGAAHALRELHRDFRLLVISEGGHPNLAQMERLRAAKRSEPRTAIVSDSPVLHALGSLLNFVKFFNPQLRLFAPTDRAGAYSHIGLNPRECLVAEMAVDRLRRRTR